MAAVLSSTEAATSTEGKRDVPVSSSSSAEANFKQPEVPPTRFLFLMIGLSLGLFLSFIDSSIVATSLFSIGADFQDLERVNWVALSYTLSYLGCAVLFARISDVIGRRDAFMAAYLCFVAFSIGCGFAQTMIQLIVFRAFQGVGGAGLYSMTMVIAPEVSPIRLRQFIGGLVGIVIAVAGSLGPVLGGLLTQYTTWRWVFWINGPIGGVSMILFYLAWPKAEFLPDIERRKWRELDYLGSVLLIAASVLVVYSFQSASGHADTWGQASFLVPLIVGLACWVGMIFWEIFVDRRWGDKIAAAFPMGLMRNRIYLTAVVNTMFLGFPYLMILYAFPVRLQVVNGRNPLIAGLMLLPMLAASAAGSMIAGAVNGKADWLCETLAVANGFMVLGSALLSTLSTSEAVEPKALGFLVFAGLGFGLSAAASTMYANLHSSVRDHAPAQGVVAQIRILGGSIGIAASSVILGVILRTQLVGVVDPKQLSSLESNRGSFTEFQLDAIRQAYADAFTKDMQVCAIIAGIATITTFAAWTPPSHRLTNEGRAKQQHKDEVDRRRQATLARHRAQ